MNCRFFLLAYFCMIILASEQEITVHKIVNEVMYPVNALESDAGRQMIAKARSRFREHGVAWFPDFIGPEAIAEAVAEVRAASSTAFVTDEKHNAYQLSYNDSFLSETHVRNKRMRTQVASIAYADLPANGTIRKLYASRGLLSLVRAVVNQTDLFRLSDPLGAASINVFKNGWQHAWHYDEAEFTITLSLQQADRGGNFELTPPLRTTSSDFAFSDTAAIINKHSLYHVEPAGHHLPPVDHAPFAPGTLQVFAGRNSLHRVSPSWGRDRLVAVLCFANHAGFINSPEVQSMFWGRVDQQPRSTALDDILDCALS